ncbi:MAG: ATP-dependent protease [Acidobacteria bacterium]|nr:MAG: ATP-dependent protease [Acidobacteriota bacterium]RLE21790.1 MAG: ATP-dependent protease [Acidobacteriota bacterium]
MRELTAPDLEFRYSGKALNFKSTDDIEPATGIVGQPKAVEALKFGLSINHDGYNIFVTGLSGTGRMTTLQSMLEEFSAQKPTPPDVCFVHNFEDPIQPKVLFLPSGKGKVFATALRDAVKEMKEHIPKLFEDAHYKEETKRIIASVSARENDLLMEFEKEAGAKHFKLLQQRAGDTLQTDVLPVIKDKVLSMDDVRTLAAAGNISEKDMHNLMEIRDSLLEKFNGIALELEREKTSLNQQLRAYNLKTVIPIVERCFTRVQQQINYDLSDYLKTIVEHIKDRIYPFLDAINSDTAVENLFPELSVNVAVDNGGAEGAPVILERTPSGANLFGTIDTATDAQGHKTATFLEIRPGALLQANGGYLVVNATDLFQSGAGVWSKLKRTLKHKLLQIEREKEDIFNSITLKPAPVPIDVKVIILGDEGVYYTLYSKDDEFKKIFKVLSEFNGHIAINDDNVRDYLTVLKKICDDEKLLPFTADAVAALLNESVRMADHREKLTARFHLIADIMREASYTARSRGHKRVEATDVETANHARIQRFNLLEERSIEFYREGTILIDTAGKKIGQVNGLAVHDYEFYAFGTPSRITARVSLGTDGIVNIEREADLSGNIHDKGVLILSGYIQGTYGHNFPLSINATICFEQSYGGVDGDSASSTELYALLSAIGNIPIRQEIAVTGSVNQYGEIQPVGGVNHKIEGYYRICREKGITGTQGVMLPASNVKNLNLCRSIIDAVNRGEFHIYAANTIDEGIELLTGIPAGDIHTEGTVHYQVHQALSAYAAKMKEFQN